MSDRHDLSEPMEFDDLEPIVVPVTLTREGRKVPHLLKEASEDAAVKWRNAAMKHARYGESGRIETLPSVADCEPVLVALCLFEVLPDGSHRAVPESIVRQMPSRVVSKLFERARKISGLDDEETEEVLARRIERDTRELQKVRAKGGVTTREEGEKN